MYSLPQEIEVWYIIPAIRKELAKRLTENYKMSFEATGKVLGISKAAVSQYISDKRGNKVKLGDKILSEIKKSAEIISRDEKAGVREIQKILLFMKKSGASCEVCKKYNKGVLEYCEMNTEYK